MNTITFTAVGCHSLTAAVKPRPDSRRGVAYVVQSPAAAVLNGTGMSITAVTDNAGGLAARRSPDG